MSVGEEKRVRSLLAPGRRRIWPVGDGSGRAGAGAFGSGAGSFSPRVSRRLPSIVHLSTYSPMLPSQTFCSWSMKMPCSEFGQRSLPPGPPQALSTLPSGSNWMTGGAGTQQSAHRGFCAAPASRGVSEPGRLTIQMLSFSSTAMPETWPRIQSLGRGLGQYGSTLYFGTVSVKLVIRPSCSRPVATWPKLAAHSIGKADDEGIHCCKQELSAPICTPRHSDR